VAARVRAASRAVPSGVSSGSKSKGNVTVSRAGPQSASSGKSTSSGKSVSSGRMNKGNVAVSRAGPRSVSSTYIGRGKSGGMHALRDSPQLHFHPRPTPPLMLFAQAGSY
jgi:hypothetical protein